MGESAGLPPAPVFEDLSRKLWRANSGERWKKLVHLSSLPFPPGPGWIVLDTQFVWQLRQTEATVLSIDGIGVHDHVHRSAMLNDLLEILGLRGLLHLCGRPAASLLVTSGRIWMCSMMFISTKWVNRGGGARSTQANFDLGQFYLGQAQAILVQELLAQGSISSFPFGCRVLLLMPRGWSRVPDGWWQRSLRGPRPPSEVWPRAQQYRQPRPPHRHEGRGWAECAASRLH